MQRGQFVREPETYRLRIQAIEPQQAQATLGETISPRSQLQGSPAKVQETEWPWQRSELSRASLGHRLIDPDIRLSTVLQDLDQARETISVLERLGS